MKVGWLNANQKIWELCIFRFGLTLALKNILFSETQNTRQLLPSFIQSKWLFKLLFSNMSKLRKNKRKGNFCDITGRTV